MVCGIGIPLDYSFAEKNSYYTKSICHPTKKRKIPDSTRKLVNQRDQDSCKEPGCDASRSNGDAIQLHHIKPEKLGGTEDPDNLISLCDIHHKAAHIEFSAYYPDSLGILQKMNRLLQDFHSRIRAVFAVDDGNDLLPYLGLLSGSKEFRLGQLKTIRAALSGRDVLFVTPTGSGKSICYQLPGLLQDNPTLVISPLKSLMIDQVESIWRKRISATYINSDLGSSEKSKRFDFIKQGLYKFIFVAPERFHSSVDPNNAALYRKYGYLVVDEAHSIDSWGKAFRPSYRKLGELRQKLNNIPTIALTASASAETQKIITSSLGMTNPKVVVTGFYRDNIKIYKKQFTASNTKNPDAAKADYISEVINGLSDGKVLIFAPTVEKGKNLQALLHSKYDLQIDFYHGQLGSDQKNNMTKQFKGSTTPESNVLISTSAFGMGIDIPNIRHVIHWSPALSIEDYYQQIGRAGRDQKDSYAHLLHHPSDNGLLYFLATVATKSKDFKQRHGYSDAEVVKVREILKSKVDQMLRLIYVPHGAEWEYIEEYFGETPLSFWEKHGKEIVDTGLVIFLAVFMPFVSYFAWIAIVA